MDIGRLESLLFEKHVVKAGQDHTGHDNDSTFVSAAFLDTVIPDFEIRVLRVFDGGKRTLDQQRLEVSTSLGDTAAFLLSGALAILRGKAGPGAEMLSGFEDRHISPGFGNDITGRSFCDAGDVGSKLDQIIIGIGKLCDGIVQPADDGIKIGRMFPAEFHFEGLVIGNFITNNGGDNIISFVLSPPEEPVTAGNEVGVESGGPLFLVRGDTFTRGFVKQRLAYVLRITLICA